MPKYENLLTTIGDENCQYTINLFSDVNQKRVFTLEIQGLKYSDRFIHRLNTYKKMSEPSEEDMTEKGKPINYPYLSSRDKQINGDKTLISFTVGESIDTIRDILDALKFTDTLSQEMYSKICQDCNITQILQSSPNISTHPLTTFSPSHSQIKQSLELQMPTPNDLIDFLQKQRPDLCNPDLLKAAANILILSQNFTKG